MRIILPVIVLVSLAGCSGTGRNQQAKQAQPIPVVNEKPSPFERQRVTRQREDTEAAVAQTQVSGNVTR